MRSASWFVILPSKLTSAFALPVAVMLLEDLPTSYLSGFVATCITSTASAIFTLPSQLASPSFVAGTLNVEGSVVVGACVVVVVVVVSTEEPSV